MMLAFTIRPAAALCSACAPRRRHVARFELLLVSGTGCVLDDLDDLPVGDLVLDPDYHLNDLFRSHDLSGWAKALWFIFILIFPLIGVLVYLIARGGKMHEHEARAAQLQEQQFRRYVQETAGPQSPADELAKLADLRDRGVITEEEFERERPRSST